MRALILCLAVPACLAATCLVGACSAESLPQEPAPGSQRGDAAPRYLHRAEACGHVLRLEEASRALSELRDGVDIEETLFLGSLAATGPEPVRVPDPTQLDPDTPFVVVELWGDHALGAFYESGPGPNPYSEVGGYSEYLSLRWNRDDPPFFQRRLPVESIEAGVELLCSTSDTELCLARDALATFLRDTLDRHRSSTPSASMCDQATMSVAEAFRSDVLLSAGVWSDREAGASIHWRFRESLLSDGPCEDTPVRYELGVGVDGVSYTFAERPDGGVEVDFFEECPALAF